MMKRFFSATLFVVTFILGGCAQLQMGQPTASADNVEAAKSSGIAPVALGAFTSGDEKAAAAVERISVRTNSVEPPAGMSFAHYLRTRLAVDLEAAGLLDERSAVRIEAVLTRNELDVPATTSSGTVAARFAVIRNGAKAYDKELSATATWPSSFVGAIAIPDAVNHYGGLHRALVAKLLADPEFKAAARRTAP